MRTDLYTKVILTVIAICLIALVLDRGSGLEVARAEERVQEVRVMGFGRRAQNLQSWQEEPVVLDVRVKAVEAGIVVPVKSQP